MGLKLGRGYTFGAVLVFLKNFTESIYRFLNHTNDRNHYDDYFQFPKQSLFSKRTAVSSACSILS